VDGVDLRVDSMEQRGDGTRALGAGSGTPDAAVGGGVTVGGQGGVPAHGEGDEAAEDADERGRRQRGELGTRE
jgi:hypothetical protein